jgi:hypothetical protein
MTKPLYAVTTVFYIEEPTPKEAMLIVSNCINDYMFIKGSESYQIVDVSEVTVNG